MDMKTPLGFVQIKSRGVFIYACNSITKRDKREIIKCSRIFCWQASWLLSKRCQREMLGVFAEGGIGKKLNF